MTWPAVSITSSTLSSSLLCSSRRRHTRCGRDWSSDVCSSDLLFGPLLLPVARSMGVHEVHYSIIVILAMGIGLFALPFGVGFYGACAIGKISPDDALWRIWPYIFALVVALVVVAAVPWLSVGFL